MDDMVPDTSDDTDYTPRWAKVFGIVVVVLIVLFVVLHIAGGGLGGH
jgi:hypothetical protein